MWPGSGGGGSGTSWIRWCPWQQVLHAAVRRGVGWGQGQVDYTYSKISRRQHAVGKAIVPALRRPVPAVAVVIDTSGSIDDGLLAQALGEVKAVLASLAVPDSSVTVLAVDAAVHAVQPVRDVREVRLAGGGGTDMGAGITGGTGLPPGAADSDRAHGRVHPMAVGARPGAGDRGCVGQAARPAAGHAGVGAAGGGGTRCLTYPDQ
jgi:hypothetical protein